MTFGIIYTNVNGNVDKKCQVVPLQINNFTKIMFRDDDFILFVIRNIISEFYKDFFDISEKVGF